MTALRLGEVIGRIGGTQVETIDIPLTTASGGSGSSVTVRDLDVPAGETWLVSLVGEARTGGSPGQSLILQCGMVSARTNSSGPCGFSAVLDAPSSLTVTRARSAGSDTVEGTLHIVRL
ncbi:hypothetical protein ACT3SZ_06515 [Corynebacterium sp. AOP40-9SA-29]|uniref:hypothetical protein n=1 Tax=Corynebacterium sp. AOP40-9SA-29 TaxID=3457677 RepID=UPI004034507B